MRVEQIDVQITFEDMVSRLRSMLAEPLQSAPFLWLSSSHACFARGRLLVFRPDTLTDPAASRARFEQATALSLNVALVWHGQYHDHNLVALEAPSLDLPEAERWDSGCFNCQVALKPRRVCAIWSRPRWMFVRLRHAREPFNREHGWPRAASTPATMR